MAGDEEIGWDLSCTYIRLHCNAFAIMGVCLLCVYGMGYAPPIPKQAASSPLRRSCCTMSRNGPVLLRGGSVREGEAVALCHS